MSDLISRQGAIEYFMTNTNWHDEDGYPIEDAEEKRKLLTDYFNGIPSAQQWTPCSEGLPTNADYYICTCFDGVRLRTSMIKWVNGWQLTGSRTYWKIIAWMPKPKPWEAKENEHIS